MSAHISSDYINFIKDFILLQFQNELRNCTIKPVNNLNYHNDEVYNSDCEFEMCNCANNDIKSRKDLFEKYDNYIKYYHELQKINTIHKFGTDYELMDFFQTNNLLELFASMPSVQPNDASQISSIKSNSDTLISFQDYVDELINIKHINMMEYQHFIKLMKEPEFNKTLQKKYIHEMELRVIKKVLNNEIDKMIENANDKISYIDIFPFCEYKSQKKNETIVKEFKLYEMETNILREIEHFIE